MEKRVRTFIDPTGGKNIEERMNDIIKEETMQGYVFQHESVQFTELPIGIMVILTFIR